MAFGQLFRVRKGMSRPRVMLVLRTAAKARRRGGEVDRSEVETHVLPVTKPQPCRHSFLHVRTSILLLKQHIHVSSHTKLCSRTFIAGCRHERLLLNATGPGASASQHGLRPAFSASP